MQVSRYVSPDIPEEAVGALTGDSLFASEGFAAIWKARGGRRAVWAVEDDNRPIAVLAGVEFGRGPAKRFMAMPDGLYAVAALAPAFRDDESSLISRLTSAIADHGYAKLFLYDFRDRIPVDQRFEVQALETTLVEIGDPEWEPPDRKLLTEVRKAEREGVVITRFDWSDHHERFMQLVHTTAALHGGEPRYDAAFFEALAQLAATDHRVQWRWCEFEDRPVASHIYFIEGAMLQGWQMYYDKEFGFLKANQRIIYDMCKEVAAHGVTTLNLGASPADATGTDFFKQRWGGEKYRYNGYVLKKGLGRLL